MWRRSRIPALCPAAATAADEEEEEAGDEAEEAAECVPVHHGRGTSGEARETYHGSTALADDLAALLSCEPAGRSICACREERMTVRVYTPLASPHDSESAA
jgi:hypothetical protein